MCNFPISAGGLWLVELPTKFSKKRELDRSHFLEAGCWGSECSDLTVLIYTKINKI